LVDLHCHTTASDGTDSSAELLIKAEALGLTGLAITDHDSLAGFDSVTPNGQLELIPAVELSVRGAHLLGYFFDGAGVGFREWLESLKAKRRLRNAGIAERLRAAGCDVTLAEAEERGRNVTGRAHFARVLLEKGYITEWEEAFTRYLGEDAPCYVEREDPEPDEGIERLRNAGAIVSLAHPVRLRSSDPDRLIAEFARAGLQALEVWHSDHTAADAAHFLSLASEYGLATTAGSDYHGRHKPQIELGSGRNGNIRGRASLDDLRRRAVHL
jgi:predicted metal-dependent phosphoesterase TrpH